MSNTFEKYSDDQLFDYLESNCPEGKLFEAFDELATRVEFYRLIVTDMANQGGMTLDEFVEYLNPEGDPEECLKECELEGMSLTELTELYSKLKAEKLEEEKRQDLIAQIKELTKGK